jgi:hypothetical protein
MRSAAKEPLAEHLSQTRWAIPTPVEITPALIS